MRYCIICGDAHTRTIDHFKVSHVNLIRDNKYNSIKEELWYSKKLIDKNILQDYHLNLDGSLTNEILNVYKNKIETKAKIAMPFNSPVNPKQSTEYYFEWSTIHFEDRFIVFEDKNKTKRFDKIVCKKSAKVLNEIRESFYKELFQDKILKLYARNNSIDLNVSKDVNKILENIDLITEIYNIKSSKNTKFKRGTPRPENLKLKNNFPYDIPIIYVTEEKTKYFNLLYKQRNIDKTLFPLKEFFNGCYEDSILFLLKARSGKEFAIWENVNLGRATYIFIIRDNTILNNIKNFITTEVRQKRSALNGFQNNKQAKEKYGLYAKYNHSDFDKYEAMIINLINYT